MESAEERKAARVSPGGMRLMIALLAAIALVSIYANVQKARRKEIETVTITPIATPSPTSTPASR